MNTHSIGFRLLSFYGVLITGALVVLALVTYLSVERYLVKNQEVLLTNRARLIAESLVSQVRSKGEGYLIQEVENRFAPETYGRFIRIADDRGKTVYVSGEPKDQSFNPALIGPVEQGSRGDSVRRETLPDGTALLLATVIQAPAGDSRYTVEVGTSLAPITAFLHQLLVIFLIVFPVAIVISIGGGHFLIRRALATVEGIASSAEQITFQNLSLRLPVANTGDELEKLSLALNRMIGRLEQSFQHTRRFSADASHELRTPLTIIRGELESLSQNKGLSLDVRESLGSLLEEAERLQTIVEGLFALAKIDAGGTGQEWKPVDLSLLATSTAEQMCLLAEDKNIAISSSAPEPVSVQGDRARLKQVIVNLLDNAIKYTPAGGKVRLSVVARDAKAVLDVEDTGIGIPAAARPHIFERFFRVDPARSREMGGAGLGLSIVKSICIAHDGQVDFQSTEGTGSRFTVELPLTSAKRGKLEPNNAN